MKGTAENERVLFPPVVLPVVFITLLLLLLLIPLIEVPVGEPGAVEDPPDVPLKMPVLSLGEEGAEEAKVSTSTEPPGEGI